MSLRISQGSPLSEASVLCAVSVPHRPTVLKNPGQSIRKEEMETVKFSIPGSSRAELLT